MSCSWCHNPESQSFSFDIMYRENRCRRCGACAAHCPQQAIVMNGTKTDLEKCSRCGACLPHCYAEAREIAGQKITVNELMDEIEKDRPFYKESGGGVTLSGGEPLAQPEFAAAVLLECKNRGIHTTLDTCGYAEWAIIDSLRKNVDFFLFDLKIMHDRRHVKHVGVSNRLILENLTTLSTHGHNIIVRFPIIPGITDDRENINAVGAFVESLPTMTRVEILPWHSAADKYKRLHRNYILDVKTPDAERMKEIKQQMEQFNIRVNIGG